VKVVIQDLSEDYNEKIKDRLKDGEGKVIFASGKYAPCQGCFQCWTKTPATCRMSDSLHEMCRMLGQASDLVIITENYYGGHSPVVKNILDRSIGMSTPFSTYRGKQMHHTLRYGKKNKMTVIVYGDITDGEKETWKLMVERNMINEGYREHEVIFLGDVSELEGLLS